MMVSSFVIATILVKTAAHIATAASPETFPTESLTLNAGHHDHVNVARSHTHTATTLLPLRRRRLRTLHKSHHHHHLKGIETNSGYGKRHTLDNQHGKENSSRQTATTIATQEEFDPFLGLAQQHQQRNEHDNTNRQLQRNECSCSPRTYNFQLNLTTQNNCKKVVNTLEDSPGIEYSYTNCNSNTASSASSSSNTKHTRIEIVSMQFIEFDATGFLIVLNQDDSYANTSLFDGDTISFDSISQNLTTNVPLEDQMEYLPGGVQLAMTGRVIRIRDTTTEEEEEEELLGEDTTGEIEVEEIVTMRASWSFSNGCDAEPVMDGDAIGWVTFVRIYTHHYVCERD